MVIDRAARKVARNPKYRQATELDDLVQEAQILVATKPELWAVLDSEGLLYLRLVNDLIDLVKTPAKRQDRTVSLDELLDGYSE